MHTADEFADIAPQSRIPVKVESRDSSQLFQDSELYLTNPNASKKELVRLDMRLPSVKIFQDNMLSMIRMVNCHPFSGLLKLPEVAKTCLSINDIPQAIKVGTIQRTSQFQYLMDLIFKRSEERLTYLHESITEHINEAKKNFIEQSTPEILQELHQVKCPHERLEIMKQVGLVT
jgi:hypothetical protein